MAKVTYTLHRTTKVEGEKDCYHYTAPDQTEVVFHAHTTRAFQYVLVSGNQATASRLINEFVSQGMKQHSYRGGFAEAIQTLTI